MAKREQDLPNNIHTRQISTDFRINQKILPRKMPPILAWQCGQVSISQRGGNRDDCQISKYKSKNDKLECIVSIVSIPT
jgi:hypothetical protein